MGRVEILTGVERRRNWTDEEKLRILDEVATSGSGVTEVARRHDILPQQIYTWRKKLGLHGRRDGASVTLLPVALIAPDTDGEHDRLRQQKRPPQNGWQNCLHRVAHGRSCLEGRCHYCIRDVEGVDPLPGRGMMGPGANARVYLACGVTDMRKGIDGLMALVQTALRQKPASGSVFVFRGRRGNRSSFFSGTVKASASITRF